VSGGSVLGKLKRLAGGAAPCSFEALDDASFVDLAYRFVLGREADPHGRRHFLDRLHSRAISREIFLATLIGSQEFEGTRLFTSLGPSLHASRSRFVRSLPAARRIVDIGGSCQDSVRRAMVEMGYPYPFESLTVVDLPNPERHALYRTEGGAAPATVETGLGPVHYLYQSMTSLHPIADASIDLVYSGQSIEHVTPEDARRTFGEVRRVLRSGGHFALDTPNARITRLQQDELIDPDHELEYRHEELSAVLREAGFELLSVAGLNYAGPIHTREEFSAARVAANCGSFAAIEDCYLLAYLCRRPND
jgi:hypothetical protein